MHTNRAIRLLWCASILVLAAGVLVATSAGDETKIKGRYRIYLLNGNSLEGDVTQLADGSYQVENVNGKKGVTATVRRNQVARVVPIEEEKAEPAPAPDAPGGSLKHAPGRRRPIADTEIQEILEGVKAEVDPEALGVKIADLSAPLPKDDDSAKDMHRLANSDKEWITDHFLMVYTGPDKEARSLGSRLESVWRWNVKFIQMLQLPARRPEHKLEVFFFDKYEDFRSYSLAQGDDVSGGVLGYYRPDWNRSHFFNMETYPYVVARLEALKGQRGPEVARVRANVQGWIDYENVSVIQHEAGHHIHFNIGLFPRATLSSDNPCPRWLVEGTTMLFEFPQNVAGAGIGTINHGRLSEIKEMIKGQKPGTQWWKNFIINDGVFFSMGGAGYPPAWSLVNYLWHEHRDGYAKYLHRMFGREPDFRMSQGEKLTEFEDCFGTLDDKWIERFHKYLDNLRVDTRFIPPRL